MRDFTAILVNVAFGIMEMMLKYGTIRGIVSMFGGMNQKLIAEMPLQIKAH